MHFEYDGPNTAVSTPDDRLWWLIPTRRPSAADKGALPKMA